MILAGHGRPAVDPETMGLLAFTVAVMRFGSAGTATTGLDVLLAALLHAQRGLSAEAATFSLLQAVPDDQEQRVAAAFAVAEIGGRAFHTVPDPELDAYIGDERGGEFQAAALLIAGIVSCPAEASDLLTQVIQAKPDDPVGEVLRGAAGSVCLRLADHNDVFAGEFPLLGEVAAYQTWALTVARYSFKSYALFSDVPAAVD